MSESVVENDKVFVSLGSNLSEPERQVKQALHELAALPRTKLLGHSSLYQSEPLDHADQPAYINAVAHLSTSFSPDRLLDHLQDIENRAGRVRTAQRWSSRTLDIDILLFGDKVIDTERLTIPIMTCIDVSSCSIHCLRSRQICNFLGWFTQRFVTILPKKSIKTFGGCCMSVIAIYPGTFDPVTLGHVALIGRAVKLCDQLIVAVATSARKSPAFHWTSV